MPTRPGEGGAKSIQKGKRTPPRPLPLVSGDAQPVRYPLRAFIQIWGELADWWTHYDADALAAELTIEQLKTFLTTADGTVRFVEALRAAREGTAGGHGSARWDCCTDRRRLDLTYGLVSTRGS